VPQNFLFLQRDQPRLMPVDMRESLPEDDLVLVVLDAVATLDLGAFRRWYRADGHGRAAFVDIEPDWTREVLAGMNDVELSPYQAHVSALRASSATHRAWGVLVVIAYRDLDGDLHGLNA
jgi:hypothetical protein